MRSRSDNDQDKSKIISRIQKLLSMAKDNSSPQEAAIAAGRAAKLLQKHNLTHAEVMLADIDYSSITEERSDMGHKRQPLWFDFLCLPVARLHDCEVRSVWDRGLQKMFPQFLGVREDALVAAYVFEFLVAEINRLAQRYSKDRARIYFSTPSRQNMYDFRMGASEGIRIVLARLLAEKQSTDENNSNGKGLVVMKGALIQEKYNVKYQKSNHSVRESRHAYAGLQAGLRVKVRQGVSYEDQVSGVLT